MIKVNENRETGIKLIRHYIKDLSFENPQSINDNNSANNDNSNFYQNMNLVFLPYKNNFFSVIMKCACEGSSKENKSKLFVLELEYFGFFKTQKRALLFLKYPICNSKPKTWYEKCITFITLT